MRKRLIMALLIIAIFVVGYVVFFYAATATEKQKPVYIETPVTKPTGKQ